MWIVSDNLRKGAATNAVSNCRIFIEKRVIIIANWRLGNFKIDKAITKLNPKMINDLLLQCATQRR
jgi:hypothetical protein